ncbi:MAG TPA: OadG family protein [Firmicutes bacterium]|nr:OadG family protein [Bacillota bacterium]
MEPKIGALTLTIVDMTIVFVVLWGLALLIKLTKWVLAQGEKKGDLPVVVAEQKEETTPAVTPEQPDNVPPGVLAAITAALASYLGSEVDGLRLSTLKRSEPAENWTAAGRLENTAGLRSRSARRFS